MHADRILVPTTRRFIGYGTHEELLDSCESYMESFRVQMGVAE
jgi:ABC-type multidrug transport system fused ATPase/permease subunit